MKKKTTKQFIQDAKKVHGNKYQYVDIYKNNRTPFKIICNICNDIFYQRPDDHINKKTGCPNCSNVKKLTNELFIEKSKKINGNKYDYSKVKIINTYTNIELKCNICDYIFNQKPYVHLNGHGCPNCGNAVKKTNDEFLLKANEIHGDEFEYLEKYKNINTKLKIKCKKCNYIFNQSPKNHLNNKHGCPKCNGGMKDTIDDFIKKANNIHENKYDYSLVNYKDSKTKVKIICPIHSDFEQKPNDHLNRCGCPKCYESKGEKDIRFLLESNNIIFEYQKSFKGCKNINHLSFDFYLPEQNIAIEYDGIQHFKPIEFFGGIKSFKKQKIKDQIKNNYCIENNINLLRISYQDDIKKILNKNILMID